MTRVCSVCTHPNRDEIEVTLVNRTLSYRDIARQHAISKDAVSRHVNGGHIAERLLRAKVDEEARGALDVVRQLKAINTAAGKILREAMGQGETEEPYLALRAIDRIHRQLELQAKLLGDLDERPITNVYIGEVVQQAILQALDPYPQAGLAVAEALAILEAENGGEER